MASDTVGQFAEELRMSTDILIQQLEAANIHKTSPLDPLTKNDKDHLLKYLRKLHGVTDVDISSFDPQVEIKHSRTLKWSKLNSIEVKNFKAIEQLLLPLDDVTIMVGPNGSGKSSALQAIHWAARAASYIQPKNKSEVVAFERLDYSPSSEPLKTAHKMELSSSKGTLPTTVTFNHTPTADGVNLTANIKIWAARNKGGISVSIEGGPAVTPFKQREEVITAYIPGLAGLSEKETILVQPLLRRQAASGDAGGVLRNVLFNIARRLKGETDNKAAQQRVKRLDELVQTIHPEVKLEVSFNDREDINIVALFDDGLLSGIKRPLETAATGVLQVIQIFAYLILFRPKLLLIDEPDAHLHPDKQERLIETLELAASEFQVQVILTTHSPNIVRAASPTTNLIWVNRGKVIEKDVDSIRALLGWGGLDKKILFFVEDENDQAIRAILKQWPGINRQISVCRCFGVDNLPRNAMLKGMLGQHGLGVKALVHRDSDFMTDTECGKWKALYQESGASVWVTKYVDVEAYFCQPTYLAALYEVTTEMATTWICTATANCSKTYENFVNKRKVINRLLYPDGGGTPDTIIWFNELGGTNSAKTIVGKTLHKALKIVIKGAGYDDKKIDRFTIPNDYEMAPELKALLQSILA